MECFAIAKEEGLIVVLPEGDITSRRYSGIERVVEKNINRNKTVIINMERVDFINSEGADFLLHIKNIAEMHGGRVEICYAKHNVCKMLKTLQLDKVLNIGHDGENTFIKAGASNTGKTAIPVFMD